MADYTEKEIITAIENGAESKVFIYLYEKIFPKVKSFVLKNGGDLDESRDIFQDALLVFCSKVKSGVYKHETEIDGFIYAVSRNIWINRFKVKIRKSPLTLEEIHAQGDDDIENVIIVREKQKALGELVEQLGKVCKELLVNVIYHKLSMSEICEKMGFANENVAKTKNYKCKQRLIQLIENRADLTELLR